MGSEGVRFAKDNIVGPSDIEGVREEVVVVVVVAVGEEEEEELVDDSAVGFCGTGGADLFMKVSSDCDLGRIVTLPCCCC